MLSEEEKESIIIEAVNRAVEKTLLLIPETIGNLMVQHAILNRLNKELYSENPRFKDHKDIVRSVIEMVEGENPFEKYEEILKKSVPKIQKRIDSIKLLDTKKVSENPDRTYTPLEADRVKGHGEL